MSEYIIKTTNMPEHVREALGTWYEINEEVVRCGDCKCCDEEHYGAWGRVWHCEKFGDVKPDGFCAWPERREDK